MYEDVNGACAARHAAKSIDFFSFLRSCTRGLYSKKKKIELQNYMQRCLKMYHTIRCTHMY